MAKSVQLHHQMLLDQDDVTSAAFLKTLARCCLTEKPIDPDALLDFISLTYAIGRRHGFEIGTTDRNKGVRQAKKPTRKAK